MVETTGKRNIKSGLKGTRKGIEREGTYSSSSTSSSSITVGEHGERVDGNSSNCDSGSYDKSELGVAADCENDTCEDEGDTGNEDSEDDECFCFRFLSSLTHSLTYVLTY